MMNCYYSPIIMSFESVYPVSRSSTNSHVVTLSPCWVRPHGFNLFYCCASLDFNHGHLGSRHFSCSADNSWFRWRTQAWPGRQSFHFWHEVVDPRGDLTQKGLYWSQRGRTRAVEVAQSSSLDLNAIGLPQLQRRIPAHSVFLLEPQLVQVSPLLWSENYTTSEAGYCS